MVSFSKLSQAGFLVSFKHRNYRLFFFSQIFSLTGNWLQMVAAGWLIYRLTDSAFLLGFTTFSAQISVLLFGTLGGVIADKWSKRVVFAVTQGLGAVFSALMAGMAFFDVSSAVPYLIVLAIMGGIQVIEFPTRQAFVVEMVGRKDLMNAIALHSLIFNLARTTGPVLAAAIIYWQGEAWCFLLNAISFVPLSVILMLMKTTANSSDSNPQKTTMNGLYQFIVFNPPVYLSLILVSSMGFFILPFQTFLPVYSQKVFMSGVSSLGWLNGGLGVGTFLAAVTLVLRSKLGHAEHRIAFFVLLFSLAVICFSLSVYIELSVLLLVIAGFAMINALISLNSLLQTVVTDNLRGRLMSVYLMSHQGMMPLGALIMGYFAEKFNHQLVIAIFALIPFLGSLFYYKQASKLAVLRKDLISKSENSK